MNEQEEPRSLDYELRVLQAYEVLNDFPTSNAYLRLQTCSNCETLCDEFLRVCLKYDDTLPHKKPLSAVNFSIQEHETMTDDERIDTLADRLLDEDETRLTATLPYNVLTLRLPHRSARTTTSPSGVSS
jgi:hypothetical protein